MEPSYRYRATLDSIYDGDTFTALVDLGFRCYMKVQVRVYGVDTPEIKGGTVETKALAQDAKEFTRQILARPFVIESYKDRESFARWVCKVWTADEVDLGDALIANGYGKELMRDG